MVVTMVVIVIMINDFVLGYLSSKHACSRNVRTHGLADVMCIDLHVFKVIVCLLKPNTQTQSYSSPETRIGLSLASGIGMDLGGKFVGNEDVIII